MGKVAFKCRRLWWSLLSLRKMRVQQSVCGCVTTGRWRLLCEARPIVDLHAQPHTVHMCLRVDGGIGNRKPIIKQKLTKCVMAGRAYPPPRWIA